ncbi:hypothetical protein DB30_07645 [Enhygromyxa salina]|uniref:Uncharacterized protein n=1 Tax=Enhygromyxa salina TaxID=215803 RepID=A0A0C1Z842_9BACT|nr:hypothetical protein DB30_07645 [Enhygromyxa salina]
MGMCGPLEGGSRLTTCSHRVPLHVRVVLCELAGSVGPHVHDRLQPLARLVASLLGAVCAQGHVWPPSRGLGPLRRTSSHLRLRRPLLRLGSSGSGRFAKRLRTCDFANRCPV